MTHTTREEWLVAAAEEIRPLLTGELPAFRVSVGWPRRSRGKGSHAIGQCWCKSQSADATYEVFISPELSDPARVLDVLAHELVHAQVGIQAGHGRDFARAAKAIGLEGKMTATVAGPTFTAFAAEACKRLGPFPHASLSATSGSSGPKKQGTRMLKASCSDCGMVIRTTRTWIEQTGLPVCACGGTFEQ